MRMAMAPKSSEYTQDEPLTILAKARFRPSDALEINIAAQDYNNKNVPGEQFPVIFGTWSVRACLSMSITTRPVS